VIVIDINNISSVIMNNSNNNNNNNNSYSNNDNNVSQLLSETITKISSILAVVSSIDNNSNDNDVTDKVVSEMVSLLAHVTRTSRQYTLTTQKKIKKENELTGYIYIYQYYDNY